MTVFVDDFNAPYGRMKMSHMIADSDEELFAMAMRIGVNTKWWQSPPKHTSHFDIALSKKKLAIEAGAIEISARQASAMTARRREQGFLGSPHDAIEWFLNRRKNGNSVA